MFIEDRFEKNSMNLFSTTAQTTKFVALRDIEPRVTGHYVLYPRSFLLPSKLRLGGYLITLVAGGMEILKGRQVTRDCYSHPQRKAVASQGITRVAKLPRGNGICSVDGSTSWCSLLRASISAFLLFFLESFMEDSAFLSSKYPSWDWPYVLIWKRASINVY